MRRPSKPFVKEYKGTVRRSRDLGSSGRSAESSWPDDSRNVNEGGGYEAALRAADALFSGARAPADASGERRVEGNERPPGGQDDGDEPRGRILRAIEVSTEDPFAALEAERTPKRRGRKPGSKNKPKLPAAITTGEAHSAALVAPAMPDARAAASQPLSSPPHASPSVASISIDAPAEAVVAAVAPASSPLQPRRAERYTWVRKRLGPGEKWKRRLPKVAW